MSAFSDSWGAAMQGKDDPNAPVPLAEWAKNKAAGAPGATKEVQVPAEGGGTRTITVPATATVTTRGDGAVIVDPGNGAMPSVYARPEVNAAQQAFDKAQEEKWTRPDLEGFRQGVENEFATTTRTAPTVAPTTAYGGATIGPSLQFGGAGIDTRRLDASKIDTSESRYLAGLGQTNWARMNEAQSQKGQNEALGLARGAALGEAPSAAALQMQSGLEAAQRAQLSAAASARGGIGAQMLARGQAANIGAVAQQQTNQAMAALRAQEMATGRAAYLGGTEQQRAQALQGQQVGLGEAQLGLGERAQNIGLGTTLRGQELDLAKAQAGNYQAAGLQAAALDAERARAQAGLTQTAGLTAAEQEFERAKANAEFERLTQAEQDQYRLGLLGNIGTLQGQSRAGYTGREIYLSDLEQAEKDRLLKQQQEQNRIDIANQNAVIGAVGSGLSLLPWGSIFGSGKKEEETASTGTT